MLRCAPHVALATYAAPSALPRPALILPTAYCLLPTVLLYSYLSATNGSTRVARRDGR